MDRVRDVPVTRWFRVCVPIGIVAALGLVLVRMVLVPEQVAPARLRVTLGTGGSASVTFRLPDVPGGARLVVPGAAIWPTDHDLGEGPFLVALDRSDTGSVRVATARDTIIDIDLTRSPSQLHVRAVTPSRARLEQAMQDLATTEARMKDAAQEHLAVLEAQRASQQSAVHALRRAVAAERVRPTRTPIEACLADPRTGRAYVTLSIAVTDDPEQGPPR